VHGWVGGCWRELRKGRGAEDVECKSNGGGGKGESVLLRFGSTRRGYGGGGRRVGEGDE